jgi:tetratricopeptide (TPR) repeat protein
VEAVHGPDDPRVGDILGELVFVLFRLQRLDEALSLAQRALRLATTAYGDADPRLGPASRALAYVLADLGRTDEALEAASTALALARRSQGRTDPVIRELTNFVRGLQTTAGQP